MWPFTLKKLYLSITVFTLVSCASVDSFVKSNDYRGLRDFCDSKTAANAKEDCYAEAANIGAPSQPGKSYELYMKLGKESRNPEYFSKAGDLAKSALTTEKAAEAYDQAKNQESLKALLMERAITPGSPEMRDWRFEEYAKKYNFPEVYENLGKRYERRRNLPRAVSLIEKSGNIEELKRISLKNAEQSLNRKDYVYAAEMFIKSGEPARAAEMYGLAGEELLSQHRLNETSLKNALAFFKLAGKQEEGQRRVATRMIEGRMISAGLQIAEEVGGDFYVTSLVQAGDLMTERNNISSAKLYYQKAGVEDINGKIAMISISKDAPNFYGAEENFRESSINNYGPIMLARAVEAHNETFMNKYADYATTPGQHEAVGRLFLKYSKYDLAYSHLQKSDIKNSALVVAEKASYDKNKLFAPIYYYLGGEREKGFQQWKAAVQAVISSQQFIQSYLSLSNPPKELMSVYWNDILGDFREKNRPLALGAMFLLDRNQPVLALGIVHNEHRLTHLTEVAETLSEGNSSEFSINNAAKATNEAAIYAQFNNVLAILATEKSFHKPTFSEACQELEKAQIELMNRNFQRMREHLDKAQKSFGL